VSPRRKDEIPASKTFFNPDDPDAVLRQLGMDVDDEPTTTKPESKAFQEALAIFVTRVEADPHGALAFIRERSFDVRQAAVIANAADTTTGGKITAYVNLLWHVTLEGMVGSMWSVDTDKARARRMANEVATCLDRCAVALQVPADINMARKALDDAESCF